MTDPLTNLVADGRLRNRPLNHYGFPKIITIDLEVMAAAITDRLQSILLGSVHLCRIYGGQTDTITQTIIDDITSMVNFLMAQTYNKLRTTLEKKHPHERVARMNIRCPIANNQKFPAWISSTLSSIGPCRITNGPIDDLVVYATSAATMANFGRKEAVVFIEGSYARLISALSEMGVLMAPFDHAGETCSYFPTIDLKVPRGVWSVYGQVYHSHYENEDVARIAFVTSNKGGSPFQTVGMIIGYVNDTLLKYQCRLATEISETEMLQILRFRVLRTA